MTSDLRESGFAMIVRVYTARAEGLEQVIRDTSITSDELIEWAVLIQTT